MSKKSANTLPETGIVLSHCSVGTQWLDYNDHMNVAYYVMAFDLGIDTFKDAIGITLESIQKKKRSTVALESHITYRQEAKLGDSLSVETRIVDFDGKRIHYYQEMYREKELLSTQETLSISFDTVARKVCEFEAEPARNLRLMLERQNSTQKHGVIGRSITIRKK
jgi:acyl-CoA thioester hydrolase